jgi:hypothetical protein
LAPFSTSGWTGCQGFAEPNLSTLLYKSKGPGMGFELCGKCNGFFKTCVKGNFSPIDNETCFLNSMEYVLLNYSKKIEKNTMILF